MKGQQSLRQLPLRFIHTSNRSLATPITRISLYGLVGIGAAIVHAGVLLALGLLMPLWAANPLAFLAASIAGYLGHARYTFRPETGGQRFARRWLVIQYVVNLSVCGVLPLVLPDAVPSAIRLGILVFTPTVLNALIWSKAARFSAKQRNQQQRPRMHADDLGLSEATNNAILQLARIGKLDGASLLVQGPAVSEGVVAWKALQAEQPDLELCLHLCLTEGPCAAVASADPRSHQPKRPSQAVVWGLAFALAVTRHAPAATARYPATPRRDTGANCPLPATLRRRRSASR